MRSNQILSSLFGSLVVLSSPVIAQAQTPPSAPVITSDAPVPGAQPAREAPENQQAKPQPTEPVPAATPVAPVAQPSPVDATAEAKDTAPLPKAADAPPAPGALKIGGGGILWFYQPTQKGQKNNLEFYNVRLTFDSSFGDGFAFHLEPRFRDTPLRS